MIGFDPDYDFLFDEQQKNPGGWCPNCGGEIWAEGHELCERCERGVRDDEE